jgi:hypothetical protein
MKDYAPCPYISRPNFLCLHHYNPIISIPNKGNTPTKAGKTPVYPFYETAITI